MELRRRWHVRFDTVLVWVLAMVMASAVAPTSATGQEPDLGDDGLAEGRYASMTALLERTIFKVDVLVLDLRFDPAIAQRLEALAAGRALTSPLSDSLAAVALGARDVWARIRFKRGVSFDQFISAIRKNARRAFEAEILDGETYADIDENLPHWYAFLRERRVLEGDEMFYRIRGDTLRTVYRAVTGEILLDQVDIGPGRRLSVIGGYFAPKSDFRRGLIESLFPR